MIGIVHAGWMHGEPINGTEWLIVGVDELDLRQCLVHVVLVSGNKEGNFNDFRPLECPLSKSERKLPKK